MSKVVFSMSKVFGFYNKINFAIIGRKHQHS